MAKPVLRCVAPAEMSDDALLAYSRGDTTELIAEHIERCPRCSDQVHTYEVIEQRLRTHLYRRTCPDTLTLGEYTLGMLPAGEVQQIADHLVECPHCAAESRGYSRFFAEPDPVPVGQGLLSAIRRLVALPLVAPKPVLAGLRGSAGEETSAFTADGIDIFVSVQRESRGRDFVLAGMLRPTDVAIDESSEARLYDEGHLLQSEPIGDLRSFLFGGVSAGVYRIEVQLPDALIELESLTVT